MERHIIGLIAAAVAAIFAQNIDAQAPADIQQQRLEQDHRLFFFGDGESADSTTYAQMISRFYEDQFRHAQDPRAPYFMLMSRKGNIAMGIGGVLKVLGCYDWDGSIKGTDFAPYKIDMTPTLANRTALQATPFGSQIFFSVFGSDNRFGNYQLYIQAKFNGGTAGKSFALKKAYATVGDWTLGYTSSTFQDPKAVPSTVETVGPNSAADYTTMLLRYMHTFRHGITLAVSAEMPKTSIPESDLYASTRDCMPTGVAFVQYEWAKNRHVRLSGVFRALRYSDLVEGRNHYVPTWGLHLSTRLRPVAPVTVYAACITGKGIGNLVKDLSQGANDLLGIADTPGRMYAPLSFGWYAGVQYNFSPSVYSTAIFSQERILPRSGSIYDGDEYKYGLYATANTFWEITPRCQVGAEVSMGKRKNMDGESRPAYRASVLAQFSF